ncbi:MAG: PAS domain S-box protein [Pseudomonadota bacterium]
MARESLLVLQNVDRRERRGVMAALDAAQCLVWFDGNGRVVDGNPNTQDLLGYDLTALKGCTHAVLTGEDQPDSPQYLTHWARIRDGELRNEERSVYTRKGSEVWSSISYAAIKNDAGQTRRVLAIIIDLSPWSWRPNEHR